MILRLREAHISNLEKARQDEGFDLETETIVSAYMYMGHFIIMITIIMIVSYSLFSSLTVICSYIHMCNIITWLRHLYLTVISLTIHLFNFHSL